MSIFRKGLYLFKKDSVRTILTVSQFALGIAVALIVVNISVSLSRFAVEAQTYFNPDFGIYTASSNTTLLGPITNSYGRPLPPPQFVDQISLDSSVIAATNLLRDNKKITANGISYITITHQGISTLPEVIPIKFLHGSCFSEDEENNQVAVISESLAQALFGQTNVIGKKIMTEKYTYTPFYSSMKYPQIEYTIVGVYQDFPFIARQVLDKINFIHTKAVDNTIIQSAGTIYLKAQKDRLVEAEKVLEELAKDYYGEEAKIQPINIKEKISYSLARGLSLKNHFNLIAIFAIIVSSIGILSVMVAFVADRAKEIGVKRALGASKTTIFLEIIMNTLYLTSFGAIIGILIALLTSPILYAELTDSISQLQTFSSTDFALLPSSILIVFLAACLIGIVFGIYPALLAANLPPSEALRE